MWPDDLRALVDALVEDEKAIWAAMGVDPDLPRAPPEICRAWLDILDKAAIYEAGNRPSRWALLRAGGGACLAAAGLGLAVAVPVAGWIAAGGLVVAVGSAGFAGWEGTDILRRERTVKARLRAIGRAQEMIEASIP